MVAATVASIIWIAVFPTVAELFVATPRGFADFWLPMITTGSVIAAGAVKVARPRVSTTLLVVLSVIGVAVGLVLVLSAEYLWWLFFTPAA